jgi:chaperonin GroES
MSILWPLQDRVIVRRIEPQAVSRGGILIPDAAKETPQTGEVIAVGPGARGDAGVVIPINLSVGDKVLFGKWSGTEVKLDGVEYLIMKESDIMCLVREDRSVKAA